MKLCSLCNKTKALDKFYKDGRNGGYRPRCKKCLNELNAEYYLENREALRKNGDLYYQSNRDSVLTNQAEYAKRNKSKIWAKYKKHYEENKAYYNHKSKMRMCLKMERMPKWLSDDQKKEIRKIYSKCPDGYHVDHIVPLQGRNVSGFHVPWNLQYLSAEENLRKFNKY